MAQFTLGVLRSRVLSRLDNNSLLYPADEIDREINDAIGVVNAASGAIQGSVAVAGGSVANQLLYSSPAGILIPLAVTFAGRALKFSSLREANQSHGRWTAATVSGGQVQCWVPIGLSAFAIVPADTVGGKAITVTGVVEPTPLSADSDAVLLSDDLADSVVELASHALMFKEGGSLFAKESSLYQKFLRTLKSWTWFQKLRIPRYFIRKDASPREASPTGEGQ